MVKKQMADKVLKIEGAILFKAAGLTVSAL